MTLSYSELIIAIKYTIVILSGMNNHPSWYVLFSGVILNYADKKLPIPLYQTNSPQAPKNAEIMRTNFKTLLKKNDDRLKLHKSTPPLLSIKKSQGYEIGI
jgi:hypothetical protein